MSVSLPDSKSGYTLALFDLNGNRVLSRNITGGESEYTLDVKALASGAYILTLFNDSQVYTGKVVKR